MMINQNGSIQRATLNLNVGGRRARLSEDLLKVRCAEGRLAEFCSHAHNDRVQLCDAYLDLTHEYYFERSPIAFEYIIDFYVTGHLHRPIDECASRYMNELKFWRIPVCLMSPCCQLNDDQVDQDISNNDQNMRHISEQHLNLFKNVVFGKQRLKLWILLEKPRSSFYAKCISLISAFFVLLSLADLILGSMPELQEDHQQPHWSLIYLEACCMLWFTLEYTVRLLVSPEKYKFVKSPLNIIDFLTIAPFYIEQCLPLIGIVNAVELRNIRGAMIVIRLMRLARVARIFKLARYSTGLRAFGETMKNSAPELSMLGMFLLTGIMLFSTAIYFFERDEPNSKFYSIPAACWWCVITMTTVGYGDLVPLTTGGKLIAALASVCGIIVLAFPISMIIDKFAENTPFWNPSSENGNNLKRRPRKYLF